MTRPAKFVTIPDVVLLEVGDWQAGSGPFKPTPEHIAGAVDAYNDGAMWAPRGKIGETVHAKKGKAVGRFENLRIGERVAADGSTIHQVRGDHTCVPADFAATMPSDYPSRSIEGRHNATIRGKTYPFVITHVELLGVDGPAVTSLPDITPQQVEHALDVAASFGDTLVGEVVSVPVTASAIEVSDEDVRRAWHDLNTPSDTADEGPMSWVSEFFAEPRQIIVDAGRAGYQRVAWDVDLHTGAITFGTPQTVERQWVPTAPATVSASAPVRVFETRRESLAADSTTEDQMDPKVIREALGLGEDATDEQVLDAARAAKPAATTDDPKGGDGGSGEGAPATDGEPASDAAPVAASADVEVKLSAGQYEELREQAAAGVRAEQRQIADENERAIRQALKETRITASEAGTVAEPGPIRKRLAVDELRDSTLVLLTASVADGGLAPGAVPGAPVGSTGSDEVAASADEDAVHAKVMAQINGGVA